MARESGASDVLLVTAAWLDEWYPRTIGRLDRLNVTTLLRVTGRETLFGLDRLREVGGLPFVLLLPQTMSTSQRHFKRLLDLFLLLVTAPVWVTLLGGVALYQLAVAGHPLLFRQVRVGVGGETFEMVKFRTMRVDAESDGVAQLSTEGDPRVIPACRWVRATRADELPQILHIVTGRMSIVGPRPGAPRADQGLREGDRRVHPTARGATGPDRPGPDPRALPHRRRVQAGLRPAVPRQLVAGARPRDHRPHHLGHPRPSRLSASSVGPDAVPLDRV